MAINVTQSPRKAASLRTNGLLHVVPLLLLLLLPGYSDSAVTAGENTGTDASRLRSCGKTPPGLHNVKIKDRDADGDVDGDDVLEALAICNITYGGCRLMAPAGTIDNVAVQIGVDGYACNQAPCYPNGLIIEGKGQQRTVFRSKVGSLAEPLLPVFHLLNDAPDGVIFRHMTIDGRKLEQPAEGQGWSRLGGTGLPHPSWPSLISTSNPPLAVSGHGGLVCNTELRNSVRFGILLEGVDKWIIRNNFIHDMGCHIDMTPCSPAIHAMRNLHEQYGTCVGTGPTNGVDCFPINPTAGTAGCDPSNVCTATGPIVGSEGMCEGFGPGSGNLCYPVEYTPGHHLANCSGSECCDPANICKGAGFVGRRSSGFGVLLTGHVDNTLVQDNVFNRITKYNGIFQPGSCADPQAPRGNVFSNNQAYNDASFINNGGCEGTEFISNSVDGSHMLRSECPHTCNLGNGFECVGGGNGARWTDNLATNNRGSGFKINCLEDDIAIVNNTAKHNCRDNGGGGGFSQYDIGALFAQTPSSVLAFTGNTSVDDGVCDRALFVRNANGITIEGGSHIGAAWGAFLNAGVTDVEFRDIAFTAPVTGGGIGLFLFQVPGFQVLNTLVQANVTFTDYATEISPDPPLQGTIRCTNIGMPSGLCTEAP